MVADIVRINIDVGTMCDRVRCVRSCFHVCRGVCLHKIVWIPMLNYVRTCSVMCKCCVCVCMCEIVVDIGCGFVSPFVNAEKPMLSRVR